MRNFLLVLCFLLTACAPAVTPQASPSQAALNPVTRPVPTSPLPTPTLPNQPTAPQAVATNSGANPLWLRIISPADGDTVSTPKIKITGQAPAETVVTVNDQILVVSSNQIFEAEVQLEAGSNLIEIVASDLNGNQIYIPLTLDYEP